MTVEQVMERWNADEAAVRARLREPDAATQRAASLALTASCAPVRTPTGTYGGALKDAPASLPGAVMTTRLLHSMRRDGLKRGVVALCISGGQGIALALEAL